MGFRDEVVKEALWWAYPGVYKPQPLELISFFTGAACSSAPTYSQADYALKYMDTKIYSGNDKEMKREPTSWCGIFATSILRAKGYTAPRWYFGSGPSELVKMSGGDGIQIGDIAVIQDKVHHFIITKLKSGGGIETVEGNTSGQNIRHNGYRNVSELWYYYRIPEAASGY